jgi:hypothetical protein
LTGSVSPGLNASGSTTRPVAYQDVSSWRFADFVFSWDYDMFGDGSKARRFGFHEFIDTERMFIDIFDNLRRRKLIP